MVRPRAAGDVEACVRIVGAARRSDGYPVYLPDDDVRAFVASPDAWAAWVAVDGDEVVGQVALHRKTSTPVMALASEVLGIASSRLGIVARLVVARGARRRGIGSRLLDAATEDARRRGLVPVLDVVTAFTAPVALYERAGWRRLGTVDLTLPDGSRMREHVYAAS